MNSSRVRCCHSIQVPLQPLYLWGVDEEGVIQPRLASKLLLLQAKMLKERHAPPHLVSVILGLNPGLHTC